MTLHNPHRPLLSRRSMQQERDVRHRTVATRPIHHERRPGIIRHRPSRQNHPQPRCLEHLTHVSFLLSCKIHSQIRKKRFRTLSTHGPGVVTATCFHVGCDQLAGCRCPMWNISAGEQAHHGSTGVSRQPGQTAAWCACDRQHVSPQDHSLPGELVTPYIAIDRAKCV